MKNVTDFRKTVETGVDPQVVMVATLGINQSERSIFSLDQSESRISPM